MNGKKRHIKLLKVIILLFLTLNISVSGYYSIQSLSPADCCTVKIVESCCMMSEPEVILSKCHNNSSENQTIKNYCGCFHSSNGSKTISFIKTNVELPKIIVTSFISFEKESNYNSNSLNSVSTIKVYESPPIYLVDSSFLI